MLSKILERLPIKHSLCHVSHSQCVLFHPCPLFSASLMWAEYPGGACALGSHRWESQWKTKSLLKNTVANLNCWARPDLVISRNRMHEAILNLSSKQEWRSVLPSLAPNTFVTAGVCHPLPPGRSLVDCPITIPPTGAVETMGFPPFLLQSHTESRGGRSSPS